MSKTGNGAKCVQPDCYLEIRGKDAENRNPETFCGQNQLGFENKIDYAVSWSNYLIRMRLVDQNLTNKCSSDLYELIIRSMNFYTATEETSLEESAIYCTLSI